jgi:DNA-binding MarR family transcriptional regulator
VSAKNKKAAALSPEAEMAIFWRILHLLTARYGNHPMGQLLVALTMVFLNDRDRPPTMTELCRATGLPKASVSRYVSWQIKQGLAREVIDPDDRRQRRLVQTPKGRQENQWQSKQLSKLFDEIGEAGNALETVDGDTLLARMFELTDTAPKRIG